MEKLYIDEYGERWVRIENAFGREYIKRISDGNIGGWFDGKGLAEWIDGNVGASSSAIFLYMTRGERPGPFDAPSDSGDRGRCVVLLRAFPEWVERLQEIKKMHIKGTSNGKEVFPWEMQIDIILSLINRV